MFPRSTRILDLILSIATALLLLLALQSHYFSAGVEWKKVQPTNESFLEGEGVIESGGGGLSIICYYCNETYSAFRDIGLPQPESRHSWYMERPLSPRWYTNADEHPLSNLFGVKVQTQPERYGVMANRAIWLSYFHLALLSSIIPLYHFFSARIIKAQPVPWQFGDRRQRLLNQKNLCPTCSYDLRATPHQCPECGTCILPTASPPSLS